MPKDGFAKSNLALKQERLAHPGPCFWKMFVVSKALRFGRTAGSAVLLFLFFERLFQQPMKLRADVQRPLPTCLGIHAMAAKSIPKGLGKQLLRARCFFSWKTQGEHGTMFAVGQSGPKLVESLEYIGLVEACLSTLRSGFHRSGRMQGQYIHMGQVI